MTGTPAPRSLLCELTYRCNLQCPYCYNPLDLGKPGDELDGAAWNRIVEEASALGVVQFGFSGGEPTLRRAELTSAIARVTELGGYANLITQGTFLDAPYLDELLEAGLAHIQISIQAPQRESAAAIAGTDVHERKLAVLRMVRERDVALTLNCVLHRLNHDALGEILNFAEREGIRRLELANVQFYGWAFRNRAALLPSREQVERGAALVAAAQHRLRGRMEITYVLPDYFEELPKPCMHGWGQVALTVTPHGRILPCPAAAEIKTLEFPSARETSLEAAWYRSAAFNAYRGTSWMPEPCRSCDRREVDFGGCRCQAFLLAGDAAATDPACAKSPHHDLVVAMRGTADPVPPVPRRAASATA